MLQRKKRYTNAMKIATTIQYYCAEECVPMNVPFTDCKSLHKIIEPKLLIT